MPYSLVPLVPNDPNSVFPRGNHPLSLDYGGNCILLGPDTALGWTPDEIPDKRVVTICDDKEDMVSPQRRGGLTTLVPDRSIQPSQRFNDIIGDMLKNPPPDATWKALQPHIHRGRNEILLGPGGFLGNGIGNPGLFWTENSDVRGPHSQTITDTFNRANAALETSTSSDGLFTWTLVYGPTARVNILSNQAVSSRAGANVDFSLRSSVSMDTADHYSRTNLSLTGTKAYAGPMLRAAIGDLSAADRGWQAQMDIGFTNVFAIYLNQPPNTQFAVVATGGLTSGDLYLSAVGSTYTFQRNGVTLLSGTELTQTGAAGERKVGWVSGVYTLDTNTVNIDDYYAADITPVVPADFGGPAQTMFRIRLGKY